MCHQMVYALGVGVGGSMGGMVTRARLRYTEDYLTPNICGLIKPAAMEKLMPFPFKIHTVAS